VGAAFVWGLVAGSSLLIGCLFALIRPIGERTLGLILAFGAGVLGDLAIDAAGGENRKSATGSEQGSAKAIVLGTVLDGIPESIVLGSTLLGGEGVSLAVLAAIFLSNLPEAIGATTGLARSGVRGSRILAMWALVMVVSAVASAVGYGLLGDADPRTIAFVQAFAAGALITMLADTMMPQALVHGGRVAGLATTLGFILAFAISTAELAA